MMARILMMNKTTMSLDDFTHGCGGLLFLGGRTGDSSEQRC